MGEEYITTTEAADVLGVSRQRVLQLIQDGRLKAGKFANVYMIERGALAHIEARPMGRPPNASPANVKRATGQKNASKGGSGKRGGKK
jgi:excisionase family DNA binding protein